MNANGKSAEFSLQRRVTRHAIAIAASKSPQVRQGAIGDIALSEGTA
jgi:hypothetical protein